MNGCRFSIDHLVLIMVTLVKNLEKKTQRFKFFVVVLFYLPVFLCRHSLLLPDLGITDFGNYSCVAENSLGRDRGFMHLSGQKHLWSVMQADK